MKYKTRDKTDMNKRFIRFLERANNMHNNKFDYSKFVYVDAKTKGVIICPKHGEIKQTPDKHLTPNSKGCQKCWDEIRNELNRKRVKRDKPCMTKEAFLKKCKERFGNKFSYNLSDFNGIVKGKIKITCNIHGEFEQAPLLHILNTTGCKKCSINDFKKTMTGSYNNFIKQSKIKHKNKYIYPIENKETYTNKQTIVKIICKKHGEFKKKAQKHLSGQGCFKCNVEELKKQNILVGGYSELLFNRKPFLKDKKAQLYYLKINEGEYYKIGITTVSIKNRIKGIKSKSKKYVKTVDIIISKEYNLHEAFKIEQQILSEFKKLRASTYWSNELLKKDILKKINKHFNQ